MIGPVNRSDAQYVSGRGWGGDFNNTTSTSDGLDGADGLIVYRRRDAGASTWGAWVTLSSSGNTTVST